MNPDENWKETRATSKDLSELLGVSVSTVEDFLTILENLIIHRFVEVISESEESLEDVSIELPYLGSLVISTINGKGSRLSISFVPRQSFYKKVRKAYLSLESPLINQVNSILGNRLVEMLKEGEIGE